MGQLFHFLFVAVKPLLYLLCGVGFFLAGTLFGLYLKKWRSTEGV